MWTVMSYRAVQQPGVRPGQAAQAGCGQQQVKQAGGVAPVDCNITGEPEPAFVCLGNLVLLFEVIKIDWEKRKVSTKMN